MAIKKKIKYYIIFMFFFVIYKNNFLYTQDISAQKYLEILYKKNKIENGYYEGKLILLEPLKKKRILEFIMLKKDDFVFWDIKKENITQQRILCNQKESSIYFYDKKRDFFKKYLNADIIKPWNHIPLFLFCDISLELIMDPLRMEKQNKNIFIYGNFLYPEKNYTFTNHIYTDEENLRINKILIHKKIKDMDTLEYRIFFLYEPIQILKGKEFRPYYGFSPTRIETINSQENTVSILKWEFFNPDYKIDDIRFIPDFISR